MARVLPALLALSCAAPTAHAVASRRLESCVRLQLFVEEGGYPILIDCAPQRASYCAALGQELGCPEAAEEAFFWRMLRQRPPNPHHFGAM